MEVTCYQINAFVDKALGFKGNAACIVPLTEWPDDEVMLRIAKENGVAETAFFIPNPQGSQCAFSLRWFTPDIEMDLCGHATLATAYTIATQIGFGSDTITFSSNSGGSLHSRLSFEGPEAGLPASEHTGFAQHQACGGDPRTRLRASL